MKLIIRDETYGKEKVIENAQLVPRKGDRIAWFYYPAPEVKDVLFDYEDDRIVVII